MYIAVMYALQEKQNLPISSISTHVRGLRLFLHDQSPYCVISEAAPSPPMVITGSEPSVVGGGGEGTEMLSCCPTLTESRQSSQVAGELIVILQHSRENVIYRHMEFQSALMTQVFKNAFLHYVLYCTISTHILKFRV